MSTLPLPSGTPLPPPATSSTSSTTSRLGRAWRLGITVALVASALVVAASVSTPTASAAPICATPPLTGTTTISGTVNTYYPALTPALAAGQANTTVNVGSGVGAADALAVGDLAIVIQMQGATINATNTGAYGDGVAGNPAAGVLAANFSAGRYEFVRVSSVSGSTIGLAGTGADGGLNFDYVNADATATMGQQRYQVVRVPQYSSVVVSTATPPTAPAWNGSTGGILILDVAANLNLNNATIDVTGRGFRPGLQRTRRGSSAAGLASTDVRTATALALNGQKAEGIAGTPRWRTGDPDTVGDGYPNGDFGRGAPGNAGGGGTDGRPTANDQNSGGGGGGNGGTGGQGGNSWSSNLPVGGFGGAGVAGAIDRIVLGGGGGAGSDNDAVLNSSGGAGGGIVLVRAGSLSGTGTITADGAAGNISGQDGAGGGGAGGTVAVVTSAGGSSSGFAGLTINARGGRGGNETNASPHGPGGGGGGGRVYTAVTPSSVNVSGGANGVHSTGAYGALPGTAGSATLASISSIPGVNAGANCIDLAVTKTVDTSPVVPGQSVSYTITASNRGPFPRTGTAAVAVSDPMPAALGTVTWTCTATAGSTCAASGSGSLSTVANLAVGGSATYVVTGTLSPSFTGTLSNTATVSPPTGIPELTPLDNTTTASAVAAPRADLSITKTDGTSTATPGASTTYTIVASNAGPSTAVAAPIADALPVGATGGTWTCVAAGGGVCGAASGAFPLASTATLPPAASVTYTAVVAISPTATGSLVNTASIAAPAGVVETNPANNSATDTDTLTPTGDLSISKTDGLTTVDAGTTLSYTIVARNTGPSTISGATVTDVLPASLQGATWTCAASVGSSCPAGGSGNIAASVTLASGGTATFTVSGTVAANATGTISNTATIAAPSGVSDPTPGNNSATDTTTITRRADLQITKTDGQTTAVPGQSVTYTIVASNPTGPSAVTGAIVSDTLPPTLVGATWTCTATGAGSSCPSNGTGDLAAPVSLAVGGTATFTVTATVVSTAVGTLVNTASIAAPGVVDPTPGNNSATDTDTLTPVADLVVTKTDGAATAIPGTPVTYTIVASNPSGPSAAPGSRLVDTLPSSIGAATWVCSAVATTCPAPSGSGDVDQLVDLPVGASLTFTVTGTIDPDATGMLSNTATLAPPAAVTDPDLADNSATDVDTLTPTGGLSITKTDGSTTAVPGTPITYTIEVGNAGPSTMLDARVTDTPPAAITGVTWTCATAGGATCDAITGADTIDTTVDLPVGATATFSLSGTVSPTAVGDLTNTARIDAGPGSSDLDGSDNIATDIDTLTPTADLSITKTDGVTTAVPGETLTYTVRVDNAGPSAVTGAVVADTLPATLTGATWSCEEAAGAVCGEPIGTGDLATTVGLPVGGSATYTISATVGADATGSLVNTATIAAPTGVTDPDPGDNSATDTDTLTPTADLSITKTNGVTTVVPGQPVTYSIVATNNGPSRIVGATVTDTLPAALTGASWTCTATPGSTCAPSGTGGIDESVTLAPSGSVTYTLSAQLSPSARNSLTNTTTIAAPGGASDPTPDNNTDTDTDTVTPQVDLAVTKTNNATSVVAGTPTTYTITITNDGPSSATAVQFTDTMPADLRDVSWTCDATAGSACPAASGSGDISSEIDVARGGSVTFTVTATIAAEPVESLLVNTATVSVPGGVVDVDLTDNAATDSDSIVRRHDLSITKTNGVTSLVPGLPSTYTVVVTNAGPSAAVDAVVSDVVPAAFGDVAWTCSSTGGGTCPSSGSGDISTTVDLPVGATTTFVITGVLDPAVVAADVANTATVAPAPGSVDPDPSNDQATDTDPITPTTDLSVTKTNGRTTSIAGAASDYTIVVANAGPSNVLGARVSDVLPADLTGASWSCTPGAGASCATTSGTGDITTTVDLPAGSSATFTLNITVSPTTAGPVVNTASVEAPAGTTDPTPGNDSATDTDTITGEADLSITKTDGVTAAVPGRSTTYTIVATNAGPTAVSGATVSDVLPAAITSASWTCVSSGGGVCGATSGSGDIATTVDLPVGATTTFTVVADIRTDAVGALTNSASISTPSGVTDPNPADNSATDTDTLTPTVDLSITKTNGQATAVPGAPVRYTIVARNSGPSKVVGAAVADTPPTALRAVSWTCAASAGSACPAGDSGPIAATVDIAAGGTVTFTLDATLASSAVGSITNTATVSQAGGAVDPTPDDNTASDTDTITPRADLSITKTNGTDVVVAGSATAYTIVASNDGPSDVVGATVADALPAGVESMSWTCVASPGADCAASGSGPIAETVDLAAGSTATFTVIADVGSDATANIVNTASIAAPASVSDPDTDNNSATDTDTVASTADLSVTKTDATTTITPGSATTYTIVVRNDGPSAAPATRVDDPLPAGVVAANWTCAPSAGANCATANGSGAIATTVDLPAAGSATFTVDATTSPSASASIVNTVTLTPAPGVDDPDTDDLVATDTNTITPVADLSITKTDGTSTAVPGTDSVYTITVGNAGPSTAVAARVVDALPASLIGATWTCATTGVAACGDASGSGAIDQLVTVAPSATVVYTITALVDPSVASSVTNSASVTAPAGTTDPDLTDNDDSDTNDLERRADLRITKTDGTSSATPGGALRYSIDITNGGPSAVTGAAVRDMLPPSLESATWTCAATAGNRCDVLSGAGDIDTTIDITTAGSVTFTVDAAVAPTATGMVTNTATVDVPVGVTELDPTDNTATDASTLMPEADLRITKTDGTAFAVPGRDVTYTLVASNAGPSAVTGAIVDDPLPTGLTGATWTCSPSAGASCDSTTGNGSPNVPIDLAVGASVEFTITARLDPGARGVLTNAATVSTPPGVAETAPADNAATDIDTITPVADLSISKTDGRTDALPGDTITYDIVVANAGPSAVVAAPVIDVIPAELAGATWTCVPAAGADCATPSGSGDIATNVDLAVGSTATFTVTAQVASTVAGTVANAATIEAPVGVNDPRPGDNAASDSTTISPLADVSITKTDGLTTVAAGSQITYSIVVTNPGPSDLIGVAVDDTLPSALGAATWTCSTTGGASCGDTSGSGSIRQDVDLPAGSTATYTVRATVAASASGTITNTAAIALPAGVVDPTPGNNTATDTTTVTGVADLSVTKSDGVTTLVPGAPVTYDITVANAGPSDAVGARLTDVLPVALTDGTWTCASTDGGSCAGASGSGDLDVIVDIPSGSTIDVQVTATVSPEATGQLANTVTIAPAAGTTDPDPTDNASTDTDSLTPRVDLSVTKSDGAETATPGSTTTYTVVVTNVGPSTATDATVVDPLPVGVVGASWTCAAAAGASCATASGTGSISTSVTLPPDGRIEFVVVASIDPWARGTITNVASALAPAGSTEVDPSDNVATDVDTLTPMVDLSITNTDGRDVVSPRDTLTYTVVASNNGPSAVIGASIVDALPASLQGATWTCVSEPGSRCGHSGATGSIDTTVDLAPGGVVTFTVVGTVDDGAVGQIVSTAMVTPPSDTVDVTPDDNRAVDTDSVTPVFALTITKVAATVDVTPGASLDYTIVVSNAGPSTATDVVVSDRMPAELTPVSWTCAGAQAATCAAGSGSGVPSVVVRIPAGGSVTLGVRTIVSNDLIQATEIVNVAVATVGSSANLAGTEATASAMVRVTPPAQPAPVQPVTPETPATPVAPAPSAPATAVPDPAPETTPTTPTTPSEPLASTGSDAASLVVAAAIATLLGMVLVVGTRRRHRQVT